MTEELKKQKEGRKLHFVDKDLTQLDICSEEKTILHLALVSL